MGINWRKIGNVALTVAGAVIPQIGTVEQIAKSIPTLKGQAKEDAAVELAREALQGAENFAGKELLNDPDVELATRGFIKAYVGLQNAVVSVKGGTVTQDPNEYPPAPAK